MEIVLYVVMIFLLLYCTERDNKLKYLSKKAIGDIGENIVSNRLSQLNDNYIVQHDVHLGRAQIDHLVFNHDKELIFTIETKLWGGIIAGHRDDEEWTQRIDGVIKYLENPIKQNEFHCREVRKYYPNYHVYSIVCFIKNKRVPKCKCIMNEDNIVNFITKTTSKITDKGKMHQII